MNEPLKIAFDAKRAIQNKTGLGNYSRFVLKSLLDYSTQPIRLLLYAPQKKSDSLLKNILDDGRVCLHTPGRIFHHFKALWRSWFICRDLQQENIDLFHGLSNELPFNIRKSGIKSVVTIHDLIFRRYPQFYKPIDRWIYDGKFKKACHDSDRIIAVSECTKRDIINYYHIEPEKISVVYQGCDSTFRHPCAPEKLQQVSLHYNLPKRFVLYVGSIEERKNLLLLAKALPTIDRDIQVIAIGKRTKYAQVVEKFINQHGLQKRMRILDHVPFEDLPACYQLATLFVYPSRYEGFGIPMLEALCSGIPAIGCTGSCLEEAGGPDSIYVHPDDPIELANAINSLWNNPERCNAMVQQGKQYAERFMEKKLCQQMEQLYNEILNKP